MYSTRKVIELLVEKGLIESSVLETGGLLNPAQSDKFIDYVVEEAMLQEFARVVRFRNEDAYIDKIGVHRRAAVPAEEARDPGVRRGVNTSQVPLHPVELMVPYEISDTFFEHNIEGDAVEDRIARMFSAQFANDIEELNLDGDTLGPAKLESDIYEDGSSTRYIKDSLLAKYNGWPRKADSANVVDLEGNSITLNVFSQMLNAMPTKYKRDPRQLRFLAPVSLEQLFRERIASRSTGAGDVAMNAQNRLTPFGVPLIPVPLMQMNPLVVEHLSFTAASTANLRYSNIQPGSVVITPTTLNKVPTAAFVETTDYTVDESAGTITQVTSQLGGTVTVKVTYRASPQIILCNPNNMIAAIGRSIRIEKDRDIFGRVSQWAITMKVDCQFENLEAVVKGTNIADAL